MYKTPASEEKQDVRLSKIMSLRPKAIQAVILERAQQSALSMAESVPKVILFLITFLLLTLFIVWYVRQEQYIYFWDYAGYHSFYRKLGMQLMHRPFKVIGSVVNSVRKNDYNMLPTLFQMPFYLIFGSSRLAYILSIAVLFAFPVIVIFTSLMRELSECDSDRKKSDDLRLTFIAVTVIALAPQLWVPLLRGYVDVVGLNVIFMVFILYFGKDWAEQTTQNLMALGFLLSLLILLRRWYAYWVVGFFFATAVNALISALLDRNSIEKLRLSCKSIFIVGATAVLSFFAVATPIAVKMLTSNYRDIYSAYRSNDSVFSHLVSLSQHFGLPLIVASVTGLLIMLAKDGKRRIALFIAVQFTTTFILFTRTQDIGVHHYYWASATIFILTAFFLQQSYSWLTTRPLKTAFLSAFTAVCLSTFLSVFHKDVGNFFGPASAVFPQLRYYPLRREDLDQVQSLLHALNDLTRDSDGKIYVLTSSMALNGSIVLTGCRDFEPSLADLEQKVLPTNDADKRDGFPLQFFKARYVVVTNPVGYHLAPENQRVIGLLAEELIKGERLGRSYERLPFEFVLEDDSRVYIYKRYKNFKAEDLKYISDAFVELYPDYRERFEIRPETIQELSGF